VAPGEPDTARAQGTTYATIPLSIRSSKEPAAKASLKGTAIAFLDNAETSREFQWRNFVTMHEERFGVWLGIDGDATPLSISAGDTLFREILHEPKSPYTWQQFVTFITTPGRDSLDIQVSAMVENQQLSQSCRVDLAKWRAAVIEFQQKSGTLPGRVTMDCKR